MVGQISWKISVGIVSLSKWCSSSMCRRLTGTPPSGSGKGDQSISRGKAVGGGDSSSPRVDDGGVARTHVSPRFKQFLHG